MPKALHRKKIAVVVVSFLVLPLYSNIEGLHLWIRIFTSIMRVRIVF
jgi:hypothetical protein